MTASSNRGELDPPEKTALADESAAPPEQAAQRHVDDRNVQDDVRALVDETATAEAGDRERAMVSDLLTTALKLIPDGRDSGELKLITSAVKELRYAYRVFGQYPDVHKCTIFGSARTPEDHPDYKAAVEFSREIAEQGWMVITGAGDGIMKAGHEGPGAQKSFGVAIRLPFETSANDVIIGDSKLINFRYFFTRKLMFLSQAEAVVVFPGGFGTLDEIFEALTLVQTGKASIIPIVLVEGSHERAGYWHAMERFIQDELLERGLISPEDTGLYKIVSTPAEAVDHVTKFYRRYHSSRYVRDELIIRMKSQLSEESIEILNQEFASLVKKGKIRHREPHELESVALDLPRISFVHTRYHYGMVRKLIDRLNELPGEDD
ncbi:MAG: TIGR00730 family Rossman fold protein [Planctomycetota bacterium]